MNDAMTKAMNDARFVLVNSRIGASERINTFQAGFEACHDILMPLLREAVDRGFYPQGEMYGGDTLIGRIKAVLEDK